MSWQDAQGIKSWMSQGRGPSWGRSLRSSSAAVGFAGQCWGLSVGRSWDVITMKEENKEEAAPESGGAEDCGVRGLCKLAFV